MAWQLSLYSLLLGVAATAAAAVALVAWRRRESPGSMAFFVLMLGASLWSAGNTVQLLTTDLQLKLLFRTVGYVGHNVAPVALLTFALVYTGHGHWVTRRNVPLLALEPMAVALVVTPTNALGWHALLWGSSTVERVGGIVVLEQSFGPWYWLNTAYNYALVLVALYLFVYLGLQSYAAARKQGFALIAGVIPPFFANIAWIMGVSPIDFTPVAFTVTGVVFAVAIYRYRLFDIVPVARETVLDAMEDGYVVLDDRDTVTDINEPARLHAAATDDPIGRPVREVLPQCADLVHEHAAAPPEEPVEGDVALVEPDGEPRYFEVRVSTIRRAQFTGRLVLLRNVTEQRTVKQRYRALIENASDLVAIVDEDGHFTYLSPSAERVLGYDPERLVGEPVDRFIHPDDREAVVEKFRQSVADPSYQPAHEYRFRHGDGRWLWLESRGRNHLDHPVIDGVVINSRDITERKTHENTLRRQNERLQSLASVVAHDLRNPLQVLSGRLPYARETGDERYFEAMANAVDRMETLVEDVVTLAREGELVREPEPVDVAVLIDRTWRGIETKDADLVVEFEEVWIEADRNKLRSIFENLFANAVEHGGSDVTVRVGTTPTGFYVEDDGDGVPAGVRPQIFERGFSTERRRSGLGLPIVRSIATAHGWDVTLADGAQGTRFEITGVGTVDVEATDPTSDD